MAKKLTGAIGIDVGSQKIKVAEVKLQGKEPVVTALAVGDTPPNAVDHTGLYEPDQVADVIKALLPTAGFSVNEFVMTISGQASVLVRVLEAPRMSASELKEHMQWEINRNIPFAESTIVSDFKAFDPTDAAANNLDVVMAIAPQSAVDTLVSLSKKLGKKLVAIDVEPLAMARSVKTSYFEDLAGKTVAIVEFGNKTSAINIYRDGQLLMPRQVPLGSEMLTKAIEENLGITTEEAEQMKVERARIPASVLSGAGAPATQTQQFTPYNPFSDPADFNPGLMPTQLGGLGTPPEPEPQSEPSEQGVPGSDPLFFDPSAPAPSEPEPIAPSAYPTSVPVAADDPDVVRSYNAMASVLEEFVAEVRRSIDYYRSRGGEVDQILMCGGGSKLGHLDEFIQSAVNIPTALYDPFKSLNVNAKKSEEGLQDQFRPDFIVAVGNALHFMFD